MWQVITVTVLFAMMAGLSALTGASPGLVTATGFVLLAAFTIGELCKRVSLPALLGYILAGIAFGPHLIDLVVPPDWQLTVLPADITDADKLAYVETLAVGVIGTLGGGELKIDELKDQFGTIVAVAGLAFLAVVPGTAAVIYGATVFVPDLVPFLAQTPASTRVAGAAMFGVFAYAMSPAATLAIIQETRSRGSFTSLVLGVVIVADLVLVASYLLTNAFGGVLIETGGLDLAAIAAELPTIGMEFGWALVIGALTGLVFVLYFRFVAREMIFFTVGAIFITSYVCAQVHAEKLLAFIVAGFIVQNLSRHGGDMIEALEHISLPVFVVYFTLKAAGIDLTALPDYLALTALLTVIRTAGLYAAVNGALRLVDAPLTDLKQRYLWLGFFSRGGVDLVLASLLAKQASTFGPWVGDFQAVIMAVVVVHIVAGPPLLQYAFNRVGETDGGADREDQTPDEATGEFEIDITDPLPEFELADEQLAETIDALRSQLTDRYREAFVRRVRDHREAIDRLADQLDTQIANTVEKLDATLESADLDDADDLEALSADVRQLHRQFRQSIQPHVDRIEQLDAVPVGARTIDRFLDDIRDMVEFETHFRVSWDESLWQSQAADGVGTRLLKSVRRLRVELAGPGHRRVHLGRIWRYYVVLALPGYVADAVETCSRQSEAFWFDVDRQLREVDALFERTLDTIHAAEEVGETDSDDQTPPLPEVPDAELPLSASPETLPYAEDDDRQRRPIPEWLDAPARSEPPDEAGARRRWAADQCRHRLDAFLDAFESERRQRDAARTDFRADLVERVAAGLERAFGELLDGVRRAGTLELPGFQFRPSTRFDRAREDEDRIRRWLNREENAVRGYQGWVVMDHQLSIFFHWFRDYRKDVAETLESDLCATCLTPLSELEARCRERPDSPNETDAAGWTEWYEEQLEPLLQRTRSGLDSTLYVLERGRMTQPLLDRLETRVSAFPEELSLLAERLEGEGAAEDVHTVAVPVRHWYMVELIRDAALRFVELNEHAERSLHGALQAVEDVERILEFNLRTAPTELDVEEGAREETASDALDRAASRVAEIAEEFGRNELELRRWVDRELTRALHEASHPFLSDRVEHLPDRLAERTVGLSTSPDESWLDRLVGPVRRRARGFLDRIEPTLRQTSRELRAAIGESEQTADRPEIRQRLRTHDPDLQTDVPVIYRRLFTPVPVDIPDFYVSRPELEERALSVADEWFEGGDTSLLLYGDRGIGKRTLVQHLLPERVFEGRGGLDADQIRSIRLGRHVPDEDALCRALTPVGGSRQARTLDELAEMVDNLADRRVVFIEDGTSLFTRSPEGLDLCRRFWRLVGHTSGQVFWVVLMSGTTARFLETQISLFDRVTHAFEIRPFDAASIEEIVATRHRVSGFDLDFRPSRATVVDRLRAPIAASEAARHPRRAYFDRLARLSRGNPMLALLYWLGSVRPDPETDARLIVDPLPEREVEVLPVLSERQRFLAALIVQHGQITLDELATMLRAPRDGVREDVEFLVRLGAADIELGELEMVRLRPFAQALLTPELRDRNLV